MADQLRAPVLPVGDEKIAWANPWHRLVAGRGFQAWAARVPLLRRMVRAEGAALFDVISGFVQAQALMAMVELRVFEHLAAGPQTADALAPRCGLTTPKMQILLRAGAALGLLRRKRGARFGLSQRGAALLGVPGLQAMIRHHAVLYRDLTDPVAFLRGQTDPDLARFWPYVFGADGARDPVVAETYSTLMSDTQQMVAADTLAVISLRGVRQLLDIGGGTGAFVAAVGAQYQGLQLGLFDLPAVAAAAQARMSAAGLADRVKIHSGSFRDDPLPQGSDAISLVRVLYDHADSTVAALLARVYDALPVGGRLIVSEPMSGGDRPDPATDVYFAFYTLAMQTGRTRSAAEISEMLKVAGFQQIVCHPSRRPFVTTAITATRV